MKAPNFGGRVQRLRSDSALKFCELASKLSKHISNSAAASNVKCVAIHNLCQWLPWYRGPVMITGVPTVGVCPLVAVVADSSTPPPLPLPPSPHTSIAPAINLHPPVNITDGTLLHPTSPHTGNPPRAYCECVSDSTDLSSSSVLYLRLGL